MRATLAALVLAGTSTTAIAQATDVQTLRAELAQARAEIEAQRAELQRQEARLAALEARISGGTALAAVAPPANGLRTPIERVGEAPADFDRMPEVAVLGEQGSVITRDGQLTVEAQLEYARADRNRVIFRGFEIPNTVLIGAFDINESRQDILTFVAGARYGIGDRFEIGARVPFVYRNDVTVLAPIQAAQPGGEDLILADESASGYGIGDIELLARYQLTTAQRGSPFLIANLQAVFPTGRDPFGLPRDDLGRALEAATGAGFYGISPSVTAILPSDPVVLFGTLGYTFNLPRNVDTTIGDIIIDRVDPGDAISGSAGIGIAFNDRTTINLGYAHSWAFGTRTRTRLAMPDAGDPNLPRTRTSRDLQIGRLLFGVTYRVSDRESVNWSVEVGATDDAADVRTVLRVPFVLLTGGE